MSNLLTTSPTYQFWDNILFSNYDFPLTTLTGEELNAIHAQVTRKYDIIATSVVLVSVNAIALCAYTNLAKRMTNTVLSLVFGETNVLPPWDVSEIQRLNGKLYDCGMYVLQMANICTFIRCVNSVKYFKF